VVGAAVVAPVSFPKRVCENESKSSKQQISELKTSTQCLVKALTEEFELLKAKAQMAIAMTSQSVSSLLECPFFGGDSC
jgi:hypothetical protein